MLGLAFVSPVRVSSNCLSKVGCRDIINATLVIKETHSMLASGLSGLDPENI